MKKNNKNPYKLKVSFFIMEEKEDAEELNIDEKTKLLQESSISLLLEDYDAIFSDFDPRPYSQRSVSDDFLSESKKAVKDKFPNKIELKLLINEKVRNSSTEIIIKKRLKEHFKDHLHKHKKNMKKIINQGISFVIAGVLLMFLATYILFKSEDASLVTSFLIVFLEPGGWFLFWEGLDLVIFEAKKKKPDLEFYKKMSKCEISFLSY